MNPDGPEETDNNDVLVGQTSQATVSSTDCAIAWHSEDMRRNSTTIRDDIEQEEEEHDDDRDNELVEIHIFDTGRIILPKNWSSDKRKKERIRQFLSWCDDLIIYLIKLKDNKKRS